MEGFSIDDILDPGSFKMLRDEILGVLKSYGLEVEPIPDPDEDEKKEYEFKFDNEEYEFKFDFE